MWHRTDPQWMKTVALCMVGSTQQKQLSAMRLGIAASLAPACRSKGEERSAEKEEFEESLSRIAGGSIRKQALLVLSLKGRISEGSGPSPVGQGLTIPAFLSHAHGEILARKYQLNEWTVLQRRALQNGYGSEGLGQSPQTSKAPGNRGGLERWLPLGTRGRTLSARWVHGIKVLSLAQSKCSIKTQNDECMNKHVILWKTCSLKSLKRHWFVGNRYGQHLWML